MNQATPIWTCRPRHHRLVDRLLATCFLAALLVGIIVELTTDANGWALIIGVASALTFGLLFVLVPRRYEIWRDRLVLVFLWRRWNVPFETMQGANPARTLNAYGYLKGVRFATAPSRSVEVRRRRGSLWRRPNLIISPEDRDEFLRLLQLALDEYRGSSSP